MGVVTYKYNQYWLNKIITNFAHFWTKIVQFHYLTKNVLKFKKIWDFSKKKLFVVSILNLIYLCDFACDVNSEYIKTRRMCIILRWRNVFFNSLSVSWFCMIWVQFEYFGQFLKFRGPFVEFWSCGKQTNSKKNIEIL